MTANGPGQDPESGADQRLTSLDERLEAVRLAEQVRTGTAQKKPGRGYSQGNRVLSLLIGGLVGGGLMGWLFDSWFGTSPWLLLVMLFLGIAGAFRSIIRISQERPE